MKFDRKRILYFLWIARKDKLCTCRRRKRSFVDMYQWHNLYRVPMHRVQLLQDHMQCNQWRDLARVAFSQHHKRDTHLDFQTYQPGKRHSVLPYSCTQRPLLEYRLGTYIFWQHIFGWLLTCTLQLHTRRLNKSSKLNKHDHQCQSSHLNHNNQFHTFGNLRTADLTNPSMVTSGIE